MIPVCAECGRKHLPNCREQRHQKAGKDSFYYPLFSHMASNHDLILLDSEMEDILQVCTSIFWGTKQNQPKGKAMIDRVMAFKSSDGQLFDNLEKLQRHELSQLFMIGIPVTNKADSPEIQIEMAVSLLVQKKAQVVDVLTMSPNAKPKARAINGGTKTRPSRARSTAAITAPINTTGDQ